ncbi:MAG TPA: hypothetical protein VFD69_03160 [Vicinamibacterales bacterium]|nr:hypothetical protein [Vicinamibacterales bacterium]
MRTGALRPALFVLLGLLPVTAGCGISVDKDDDGRNKNVSITTPVGNLSVKADADTPPDTGLAVHAGARALRDEEHENANVNIEGGFFGVKVAVARYEDTADTEAIVDYYKKELAKFGAVTECHGDLDFKDGESAPRCKQRSRDEIQLGAGSEADNHIVSVKPRGSGAEFTLIHVQTRS